MRPLRALLLVGILIASSRADAAKNGIFVGEPKLYDDYALEQMLIQAEQSLGALELNKPDAISSALGSRQGAQSTRTQFSLTATQLPTPGIQETESATPSKTTNIASFTPTPATLPNVAEPTLPSDPSLSAVDKLDELLQAKLRVSNLRLLLRGSLTDQISLIGDDAVPQSRFTFGFPITIATPSSGFYRDAIAEVEVRVRIDKDCAPLGRPGLKMVLPQEKTYNVAQLKSSAASIGTGVIAGVFSVGGNWLRGQSQHFIVQDQDTLAFERRGDDGQQIVFGWRFKPVLGQRKVQPSMQQLFAQLTFPLPDGAASLGKAEVITRWRRYERKTGALGDTMPGTESDPQEVQLKRIDLAPGPAVVRLLDLGDGRVRASLQPEAPFFEGTTFRLGGSSPVEVPRRTDHVELDLAALELIRQGVFVGVRGEKERELVNACNDPGKSAGLLANCEAIPSVKRADSRFRKIESARSQANDPTLPVAAVLCNDQFSEFKITMPVAMEPVGQSTTRVKLTLDKLVPEREGNLRLLTVLGDKVFGLRNAPYELYDPPSGVISFIVDNATLDKADAVEVVRLLWGPGGRASQRLNRAGKLSVAKHTIVSEAGGLLLLIEGQGLDQAEIKFPAEAMLGQKSPGHAVVFIPTAATSGLKHLVLQAGAGVPVLVDVSKSSPPPAVPVLNPSDPVRIGTMVEVPITWKNEAEIQAVLRGAQAQTIVKSDKSSAVIRLDDALTSRPGKVALSVKFKDGTELPLTLQIVDQQIAVVQQ